MRLIQFRQGDGSRRVGWPSDDGSAVRVVQAERTYDLALEAIKQRRPLEDLVLEHVTTQTEDYDLLLESRRVLTPFDHPDDAHFLVTGTGLTHLGSAESRDAMHAKLQGDDLTDSMKMFKWGLEGGQPEPGRIGVQPEWFYKGDGAWVVAPEAPLQRPNHALYGGEESEIAGAYLIGPDHQVYRVGFALANEFSDHLLEQQNYLYLAHSKLRSSSFGPELRLGELPERIQGQSCIYRAGQQIWQADWHSGEANMNHSLRNLEHHHFKYDFFRRPGDAHLHFFGAAVLSFSSGLRTEPGDVFEISSPIFGRPLRNSLQHDASEPHQITVKTL
jgi:hypothetical protein